MLREGNLHTTLQLLYTTLLHVPVLSTYLLPRFHERVNVNAAEAVQHDVVCLAQPHPRGEPVIEGQSAGRVTRRLRMI